MAPATPAPIGERPGVLLCLTPTKNEAWIIEQYAAANATWADHLLVADQGSTDGTTDRIRRLEKVLPIVNAVPAYDEGHRQRLLIDAARGFEGRRIMVALDADEALSANARDTGEWARLTSASPGTVLRFKWVNVLPGFRQAWIPQGHRVFGFVDDGSEHRPGRIHSTRVPQPDGAPVIDFNEIVVLHFQYVAWERMLSKHRWYQAWEMLERPHRGALDVFRQYHHMLGAWNEAEIVALEANWLLGYKRLGIDHELLQSENVTWWDAEILRWLKEHGTARFRRAAIWDRDWCEVAKATGVPDESLKDPRTLLEAAVHKYLAATQRRRSSIDVRLIEKCLRTTGW